MRSLGRWGAVVCGSAALLAEGAGVGAAEAPRVAGPLVVVGSSGCVGGSSARREPGRPAIVNVDGWGRPGCVRVVVRVPRAGTLELVVARRKPSPGVEARVRVSVTAGVRSLEWRPPPGTRARTYVTHVALVGDRGVVARTPGPVLRVRAVSAWFERSSYPSGAVARLRIDSPVRRLRLEITDALTGTLVATPRLLVARRGAAHPVRLGRWPSGVYVASLTAVGGLESHALLVVRSALAPRERVAVVLPTYTWQAYNLSDGDADGVGDTWYAHATVGAARLDRAYFDSGLPPHFEAYDAPFLGWLGSAHLRAEFMADEDLETAKGRELARRFDLIVFPGHHEYVTEHGYDVIEGYRDAGGNLAFLTSDALHWRIRRDGATMVRMEAWRRIGRPESRLVGVQYRANDGGTARRSYVVRSTRAAPWLFAGTGLGVGDTFAPASGIEISGTTWQSPKGTRVLAEIPALYGAGLKAQMTYYATPRGAKVFASGSFTNMAASPVTRTMLLNLWTHLSRP